MRGQKVVSLPDPANAGRLPAVRPSEAHLSEHRPAPHALQSGNTSQTPVLHTSKAPSLRQQCRWKDSPPWTATANHALASARTAVAGECSVHHRQGLGESSAPNDIDCYTGPPYRCECQKSSRKVCEATEQLLLQTQQQLYHSATAMLGQPYHTTHVQPSISAFTLQIVLHTHLKCTLTALHLSHCVCQSCCTVKSCCTYCPPSPNHNRHPKQAQMKTIDKVCAKGLESAEQLLLHTQQQPYHSAAAMLGQPYQQSRGCSLQPSGCVAYSPQVHTYNSASQPLRVPDMWHSKTPLQSLHPSPNHSCHPMLCGMQTR